MKKILKRTSLLLISALMSIAAAQAQKSPQDMDRFIDALMKKMTVEEKIGQLNLPVTGDITTGPDSRRTRPSRKSEIHASGRPLPERQKPRLFHQYAEQSRQRLFPDDHVCRLLHQ